MEGDPASGIGILAALGAGLVSFLSPCVLPLVPGYLSAVTGVAVGELDRADWRRVLVPSLLFVASFSTIFILLGLTATGIGQTLQDHRDTLEKVAGVLIVAMGVLFVASLFVARLNREWHVDALMSRAGKGGPVVAGHRVRDRLDAVHRADPGRDPQRGLAVELRRPRRLPARRLFGRARHSLPGHRARLLAPDHDLRGRQAPLHGDHGRRRRRS